MPQLNFNMLATEGPQGVYQGFMQGQQLQNRLAQQEQQRQLGELQLQNALREQRLAGEEEAAWKAGAGNPQAVLQQLQQRGLGKQAMALQSQLTKQQADKLAQQKTTVELVKNAANQVFANPQNAAQILQSFSQRTGIDVSDDLNQIQQLGGDVEAIKRWAAGNALEADKLLPKFQQFDQGGAIVTGTVDPLTGKFAQGTAFQKSMAPGEAERINLDRQRVGLERERVDLAKEDARLKREGIDGVSPKDMQKREAAYPAATQAMRGFEAKSAAFLKDLIALRDHPGLSEITGFAAGRLPGLTADGRAAQALYDKVVAKGGFQALQDMRDASKTGGALGNVSNQEGKQLTASFAAIDRRQDAKDVQSAIDQVIGDIEGANTRMREAYDATYAYRAGRQAQATPPRLNPQDQEALKWANANPKDPRAAAIKQQLGVK